MGSSLHERSSACASNRSKISRPAKTPESRSPAGAGSGRANAKAPAPASASVRKARRSSVESLIASIESQGSALGRRTPGHFLGQGAMLGTADHREIGAGAGGVDEPADRLPAPHGRSDVEDTSFDVPADRRHGLVSSLRAPTDEREIAAGAQEPSSRAGDAPGAGDGGHLEVIAQDETVEAETSPQQTADDLGRQRRRELRVERAIAHVG